ncbi:hypothetical protein [Gellertiella hungarica]|uniref:Outer membrane lipoprotein n=1 Tax=Gellertiella hungarica TaxID=1572859 RepID=A0A7W6J1M5_9HYPH|nr:hypothetical protein [Gellertiella hungarica]MBB4063109.1 hypothetical protein [Gellertiella hungarica]
MKSHRFLALIAAGTLLAACQSSQPARELPAPVKTPTVEGAWQDKNALVSTFQGGQFVTRTTDGYNAVLATGTYTVDPSGIVQVSFISAKTKKSQRANCQLATATQLNCTSDTGAQFSLMRRADMPVASAQPMGAAPAGSAALPN